jgi:hypothetical protein
MFLLFIVQSASGNTAGKELTDLVMSVFHDPVLG